jgi:hypothetical protein
MDINFKLKSGGEGTFGNAEFRHQQIDVFLPEIGKLVKAKTYPLHQSAIAYDMYAGQVTSTLSHEVLHIAIFEAMPEDQRSAWLWRTRIEYITKTLNGEQMGPFSLINYYSKDANEQIFKQYWEWYQAILKQQRRRTFIQACMMLWFIMVIIWLGLRSQ